ncbi:small subunit ribosomal protein S19e [Nematocida sp. AWRm80]|nr:small subunit ribosomal protein S19e [Nematocida sp. AWRm80]
MKVENVCPVALINALSTSLREEKKLAQPKNVEYIKTGHGRQRAPEDPNWYFIRSASVLRKIYMEELTGKSGSKKGLGTLQLARAYGGSKNNGHKPSHTVTGSKSLVRSILQGLEGLQLVESVKNSGRVLTPAGRQYLEQIADKAQLSS